MGIRIFIGAPMAALALALLFALPMAIGFTSHRDGAGCTHEDSNRTRSMRTMMR